MIFGSFANFAQNIWGNYIIILTQILISLSFLAEGIMKLFSSYKSRQLLVFNILISTLILIYYATPLLINFKVNIEIIVIGLTITLLILGLSVFIYSLLELKQKKERLDSFVIFENVFLASLFYSLGLRNLYISGSSLSLLISVIFLLPYYIYIAINTLKLRFEYGKLVALILFFISICSIIAGLSLTFKILHWPFATLLYIISLIIFVFIISLIRSQYTFENNKVSFSYLLSIPKNQIILIFLISFIYSSYKFMVTQKIAPDFYSSKFPAAVDKLRDGTREGNDASERHINNYLLFLTEAKKNGY